MLTPHNAQYQTNSFQNLGAHTYLGDGWFYSNNKLPFAHLFHHFIEATIIVLKQGHILNCFLYSIWHLALVKHLKLFYLATQHLPKTT